MTMKRYKTLPVYIVEDHNEVVPHLHRSIGSKHLPMENVALIHFDSHPDLLIPVDMEADTVYDKDKLYEVQSIENWIMPALYVGHISDLIWFKPPWADQIQDQTIEFFVGKSVDNGCIRTSCTENYFVSETLYLPEIKMVNKRKVRLTVLTVKPREWEDIRCQKMLSPGQESELNTSTSSQKSSEIASKSEIEIGCDKNETRVCSNKDVTCEKEINIECSIPAILDFDHAVKKQRLDLTGSIKSTSNSSDYLPSGFEEKASTPIVEKQKEKKMSSSEDNCAFSSMFFKCFKQEITRIENRHFILDIDLDFLSTKNPFREIYTDTQYCMLRQLYEYEKPTDTSAEALELCSLKRQKQLWELKAVFQTLNGDDTADIDHPRKRLIQLLIADLKTTSLHEVNFELLHEAGCTCDDTELPHHVSSLEQIIALVDTMQEIICHFHKPTIITISRSSNDDYCPPNQVDFIQDKVLEMLQDLYLEIAVTMDYENSFDK